MSTPHAGFSGSAALVPGELRGYRRFRLADDGLYPTVHSAGGPWSGVLEQAVCAAGEEHEAPARDCGCGLYGWYAPADARDSSGFGNVIAVIVARGRTVLGDHGFRAARARVEAVALPPALRLRPAAAAAARARLAGQYPDTAVYDSVAAMMRAHPPSDVRELAPTARPNPARRYRSIAMGVWAVGVLALYTLLALPRGSALDAPASLWVPGLLGLVAWQATLVWLAAKYFSPDRRD